jgi:RNA polymerase sigma-70 factor, ECF subfamily
VGANPVASAAQLLRFKDVTNESLVTQILEGDTALFEILVRRNNQRLYRIARGVLRDNAEAEDVMQDAYVKAYENLRLSEGRASFFNLVESNCVL